MKTLLAATAALIALGVQGPAQAADAIYYRNPASTAPFSEAVQAGDFLFVAGQTGTATGTDPTETFKAAARVSMDRISAVLKAHGSSMDELVQCQVMLADMKLWDTFNEVYVTYFKPERLPSRDAFGANGLARGAPLEVTCFAYHPLRR